MPPEPPPACPPACPPDAAADVPPPPARRGRPPTASPVLPEIRAFLAYLATERGLAPNSLLAYRRDLTDLAAFLAPRNVTLRTATAADFRDYLQDQSRGGQSTKTVTRRLAAIRAYGTYLAVEGIDKSKELQQLDRPKPERDLPQLLTRSQLERLLVAPNPEDRFYHRDLALLELLYASGLRASEICTITIPDLNLTAGALRVFGKGSKERVVPVGQIALQAIGHYLQSTRPRLDRGQSAGRLFLSKSGLPLERVALWQIIKRSAQRAGLLKEVHPHVLRHCFASHLVEGGADLRVVQELLGHADITTTQIYTHVDTKRLKKVHAQYHPRG